MTILKDSLPNTNLGFGIYYCPKMMIAEFKDEKWSDWRIEDCKGLDLHPGAKVLHYAQEIFEGLKAYRSVDGKLQCFRPEANIERMSRSAELMSMPPYPEDEFLKGMTKLLKESEHFTPEAPGAMYIRPTMLATTPSLGVQPASEYLFYILLSPVGGYFGTAHADKPVQVSILATEEHSRAVKGGIGSAKTGGNYAASLRAIQNAKQQGFNNVLFLDAIEKKHIEELGGMNVFAVINGELHTPRLSDTILAGITRDSIIQLAQQKGIKVVERDIPLNDLLKGIQDGSLQELFASGTAAVITSIMELGWRGDRVRIADGKIGKLTAELFTELTDIHYGRKQSPKPEWVLEVK